MAIGKNLEELIADLRMEIGQSTNPAVSRSTRARYIRLLNRHQRQLHREYDWPFLEIKRDIRMEAGSRYYDFPADIDMDRQIVIENKYATTWHPVKYGITAQQYNEIDSDTDQRLDPVLRWGYYTINPSDSTDVLQPQIEVWPVPASDGNIATLDGCLRVKGIRKCIEMVNDADVCVMDSDMVVLYAAAEILAKFRSPDAQAKLDQADNMKNTLKNRATPSQSFTPGGDTFNEPERRKIELRVAYTNREGITH